MNHLHMPDLHPWKAMRPWTRHSLVLFVAGAVYIIIGYSYWDYKPAFPNSPKSPLYYALELMSLHTWGYVWAAVGLLAIVSSRWPPISATWGYTVLTALSSAWAAFYATAMIFADAPFASITGLVCWAMIAFLWWAVSGLLNPTSVIVIKKE